MSAHLLAINIGPVQDFIAAARRTRDLWFGSHMLSEVSKAAARSIQTTAGMGALIFPAPHHEDELFPTPDGESPKLTVANVILALLPDGIDSSATATRAESTAKARWREFAESARRRVADLNLVRDDVWEDQVNDVIEFYAAWVPTVPGADYAEKRKHVMRLLSARKACRDFRQPQLDAEKRRLPKSSLDGARETILKKGAKASGRLRLADGEQLDCVGLTKRLAGGIRPYPSVARIAADPWLRRVERSLEHRESFRKLLDECETLGPDILSPVSEELFSNFRFEGTAVYVDRHPAIAKEVGVPRSRLSELTSIVKKLTGPLSKGGLGEPDPYLAVLTADGDRIGAFLSSLSSPETHRDFSRRLAEFAKHAREIIRDCRGVCIYAAGDDVLALVPLDHCLDCARRLRDQFEASVNALQAGAPTLSVGIAVAHFMEPLEDLRSYALGAEWAAKRATPNAPPDYPFGERNGLALHVHPRGGAFFGVREQWREGDVSLERRLNRWAALFQERRLPQKLPYDLRELTSTYRTTWSSRDCLADALQKDCARLLRHKQIQKQDQESVTACLRSIPDGDGLLRFSTELLVAQRIGGSNPESGRREKETR